MIIIGEKINGAIPSAADAINSMNTEFIKELALRQVEAGSHYLDICAGTSAEKELATMKWLIDTVQEVTDVPLCIDSPNPEIIKAVFPLLRRPGIINSVSNEGNKCNVLFPILKNNDWSVIALTCNDNGIPEDVETKVAIAFELIDKAAGYGIGPERIYIDPLVLSLSAVTSSMLNFMEAVRKIKAKYPTVKITSGLSNISFGMPHRKAVNQGFLTLALSAGMDSAILDPTNRDIYTTILSTEALLSRDKFCRNYNKAFRSGRIGPLKN